VTDDPVELSKDSVQHDVTSLQWPKLISKTVRLLDLRKTCTACSIFMCQPSRRYGKNVKTMVYCLH